MDVSSIILGLNVGVSSSKEIEPIFKNFTLFDGLSSLEYVFIHDSFE